MQPHTEAERVEAMFEGSREHWNAVEHPEFFEHFMRFDRNKRSRSKSA